MTMSVSTCLNNLTAESELDESALIFCAAPGRVTAIVYSWRIRNHTTEIAMNNTYFS